MPLNDSLNRISAEFVMSYPPGIPILAPGERITGEILDYIRYAMDKGSLLTGPEDMTFSTIGVLENME
jgi:arginine/lysine/ornithine decarboxylase